MAKSNEVNKVETAIDKDLKKEIVDTIGKPNARRVLVDAGLLGAMLIILVEGILPINNLDLSLKISLYSVTVAIPLLSWGTIASVLDDQLPHEKVVAWLGRVSCVVVMWGLINHISIIASWVFIGLSSLVFLCILLPRLIGFLKIYKALDKVILTRIRLYRFRR